MGPLSRAEEGAELVAFLASDRAASTRGRPLPLPVGLRIMVMVQYDKFKPEGFSGAPVLTADNKVIGTMLAAAQDGDMRQGAKIANIRKPDRGPLIWRESRGLNCSMRSAALISGDCLV